MLVGLVSALLLTLVHKRMNDAALARGWRMLVRTLVRHSTASAARPTLLVL